MTAYRRPARRKRKLSAAELLISELFAAWVQAADEFTALGSDPAEARCRAARAAYYLAAWGSVPPCGPRKVDGFA